MISTIDESRGCIYVSVINTHNFGRFWSVSCTTTHLLGPRAISRLTILGVCLRVCRQHSQFWPILTLFVDYYLPFGGPKAISMVVEPQGALMCRSSTITVLANSDPFHGLLLTVLGSQSYFYSCRIPSCAYMLVVKSRSLG